MAPRPGSTLPPQGGKGGGRQPTVPAQGGKGTVQQPGQPQVPMAGGKAPGVVQPGQSPYTPIGLPPSQVPAQGGKAPIPMGGMLGGGNPMQPQVPAQGGKAPLTQEQISALAPNIDPVRPMPLVQQPAPGIRFPSDFTPPAPGQTYINPNINPAGFTGTLPPRLQQPAPVMPAQPQRDLGYGNQLPPEVQAQINATRNNPQVSPPQGGFPQRDLGYGIPPPRPQVIPQPQVMPRPVPQVMPRQPTPKPAPQGLAQIQQMLRGRR
jgi:hypothetical protein